MNLKKGFTLAEVLIVLIVIGVIATLTIPSLMRGVQEAQWKTAYKKAFNSIVNVTATERVQVGLPAQGGNDSVRAIYDALVSNLSVKYFVAADVNADGVAPAAADYVVDNPAGDAAFATSPWIVSDDNLAYQVISGSANACGTKADITDEATSAAALGQSCAVVVVDVNGLASLPNSNNDAIQDGSDIDEGERVMPELTSDRYYVYVGSDGATSGNRDRLVTGRIVAGGR